MGKRQANPASSLSIANEYGTKGCGPERLSLPQARVALEFPWQGFASAVASHSPSGDMAQRPKLTIRRRLSRNRKQTNPACVTHSALVLSSRHPRGTVHLPEALLRTSHAGKGQGAASREKWQQGVEFGTSKGPTARKGTEYAQLKLSPWLGVEKGSSDTISGRKGLEGQEYTTKSVVYGTAGDPDGAEDAA